VLAGDPFAGSWPEFMQHDPTAWLYYSFLTEQAEHVLLALDDGQPVAAAYSVGFAFPTEARPALPDAGWDQVVRWAHMDRIKGVTPTACSALEIIIHPDRKGTGLSPVMLDALRRNAFRLGYDELLAPVRPSAKAQQPHLPMAEYAALTRADDLPQDPWLRVHVRAGGEVVAICPTSMTIPGTLEQWRTWTGLAFDLDGEQVVPGALSPVHVSLVQDYAVYVEPNVWVRHRRH